MAALMLISLEKKLLVWNFGERKCYILTICRTQM